MYEDFSFKYSPVDFKDVLILIFDDNSVAEQKDQLRDLCKKYDNIKWINPEVSSLSVSPIITSFNRADKYLTDNHIDVDWLLFFENDVFPFQETFWNDLDSYLDKSFLNEKVGFIGFSNYQNYSVGPKRIFDNCLLGRGNLINGILRPPYNGWYKNLSEDYYKEDYFVIESPNWQSVCVNRKLFRENVDFDRNFSHRLFSVDDAAHQFMLKNIFTVCAPNLAVYHDKFELKDKVKLLSVDGNYIRSDLAHNAFKDKWGYGWGYRNKALRNQFESTASWWSDKKDMYDNSIQKKLFNMHIDDGPKRIEDFE